MSTVANPVKLEASIRAAEQFLKSARKVASVNVMGIVQASNAAGPKETGQLRRDSLNLTRSLAELRNFNINP